MNMKKKMTVHRLLSGALVYLDSLLAVMKMRIWRYDVNMVLLIANS